MGVPPRGAEAAYPPEGPAATSEGVQAVWNAAARAGRMPAGDVPGGRTMSRPIELTGVIHGKTITLDEDTFVPDGSRVTLHLILTREEAFELSCGAWKNLTPEQIAELEACISEYTDSPFKMPEVD
jgi:hypothetical protein